MKQVISYSLYGDQLRFTVGAIKNAQLAQRFFPDFTVRYYYGKSVPKWVLSTLILFENVELIKVDDEENNISRTWRFMACLDEDVDVVLSRDVDARLSIREAEAHQEFLDSDYGFHIIRDHPRGHGFTISAGMFAIKTKVYGELMREKLLAEEFTDQYMADQNFMSHKIYPEIKDNCLIHDPYYGFESEDIRKTIARKPPSTLSHIGCAVDENDVYVYAEDRNNAILETGHVTYIYDWGKDGHTDNR